MSKKYLGDEIDIHAGGEDLIFPHHENEIAQSEAFSGKTFARFWMHNGYINIDNKKMSKSLNNFFTVRDVANAYGYEPIRYLMLASHYRSPINYSKEVIEQCIASLDRLYSCRKNLDFLLSHSEVGNISEELKGQFLKDKEDFISAMEDDLNTAVALSSLFNLVRDINSAFGKKENLNEGAIKFAMSLFDELSGILGLVYNRKSESLDEEIEALIEKREKARKEKNWVLADKIRDELKGKNIVLEDTQQGVKWSFLTKE